MQEQIKICSWLDKEQLSGIQIRNDGNMFPCCIHWIQIGDKNLSDYNAISLDDIQKRRENFLKEINNGEHEECQNCPLLKEQDSSTHGIGAIKHLVYHPHTLCNIDCKYCFYTQEQKNIPIKQSCRDLYKTIEHFYEIGLLDKNVFDLDLGGGEPLLLENIDKTLDFMNKNWSYSTLYLLSNFALTDKVNQLIETVKNNKYLNVNKQLITSIDCGTRETYFKIKGKDVFYQVANNLYNCAVNDTFSTILLKYILLDDNSNTDDENIFGFLKLCKVISENQKGSFLISIDVDWLKRKNDNSSDIPEYLLRIVGKMYYIINEIMQIGFTFASDYLSENTEMGIKAIKKIKEYAIEYKNSEKTQKEIFELNALRKNYIKSYFDENNIKKESFIQKIFSVKKEKNHKIIKFLGLKIKVKMNNK